MVVEVITNKQETLNVEINIREAKDIQVVVDGKIEFDRSLTVDETASLILRIETAMEVKPEDLKTS